MKVLYDFQCFNMQKYGGVSNGFVQFISNLPSDIQVELGLKGCENYHLRKSKLYPRGNRMYFQEDFKWMGKKFYEFLEWHFKRFFPTQNNTNWEYSKELIMRGDYDILHPTYFNSYFLSINKKPFILTIHDMTPEIYGFASDQIQGKIDQVGKAAHIVTMSENTKNDIVRLLNVDPAGITVTYPGFYRKPIDKQATPLFKNPYILFVGARWAYKRFDYFVAQSAKFIESHPEFHLVCTGTPITGDEQKQIVQLGLSGRVHNLFCSEDELNNLYAHAFAFVFASECEGFGLPTLEAFNAQCPTILNNKSCFPEIAQDGALYFDSQDDNNTLLMRLEELYNMSAEEKQTLLDRANKRLEDFSWKKSSEKLAEVYRKVYKEYYV